MAQRESLEIAAQEDLERVQSLTHKVVRCPVSTSQPVVLSCART